jgi:hypothetical protein
MPSVDSRSAALSAARTAPATAAKERATVAGIMP